MLEDDDTFFSLFIMIYHLHFVMLTKIQKRHSNSRPYKQVQEKSMLIPSSMLHNNIIIDYIYIYTQSWLFMANE